MKLLVIVFCLMSERFLVHILARQRFSWFSTYYKFMNQYASNTRIFSYPWAKFFLIVSPFVLGSYILLHVLSGFVFGFIGLLLQVVIFYYCLGPENPFYPTRVASSSDLKQMTGEYLANVNEQLFAVIFWYIILGPVGALLYRLTSLCQYQENIQKQAHGLMNVLNWVPARLTSLTYLVVGHFQKALPFFSNYFWSIPGDNKTLLSMCGVEALDGDSDKVEIVQAEVMVEHALIVWLVVLAVLTIMMWLT